MGILLDPRSCSKQTSYSCDIESKSYHISLIIGSVFIWLMVFTSIAGNLLVMIIILTFNNLRKNVTNLFIFSLALADLLISILVLPLYNLHFINCGCWHYGFIVCRIFIANDVFFGTASIVSLLCISVDRYIAVIYPLHYASTMTQKRAIIMIILSWLYSIFVSHFSVHTNIYFSSKSKLLFEQDIYYCGFEMNAYYCLISGFLCFYLPGMVMTILYCRIFYIARFNEIQSEKMVRKSIYRLKTEDQLNPLTPSTTPHREHKAIKTFGIIMGCFIICWLGFYIYLTLAFIFKVKNIPNEIVHFLFILGFFNSCINPFIYSLYNREFKKAIKHLLNFNKFHTKSNLGSIWFADLIKEDELKNSNENISPDYKEATGMQYRTASLSPQYRVAASTVKILSPIIEEENQVEPSSPFSSIPYYYESEDDGNNKIVIIKKNISSRDTAEAEAAATATGTASHKTIRQKPTPVIRSSSSNSSRKSSQAIFVQFHPAEVEDSTK